MRRAQGVQSLPMIILTLMAIIALMTVLTPLLQLGEDRSPASICRTSIASRTSSAIAASDGQEISWAPVMCNTVDSIISPDTGIWSQIQSFFDKNGQDIRNKEKAMHIIAEKMVECRYMMNDAKSDDYFNDLSTELKQGIFGWNVDDPSCFLCSTITISDFKLEDGSDLYISPIEFTEFINSQKSPRLNILYRDYLQGGGNLGGETVFYIQEPIRNEDVMAVLFFSKNAYSPPDYYMDYAKLAAATGVTAVGTGMVLGAVGATGAAGTIGGLATLGAGLCGTGAGCLVGGVILLGAGIYGIYHYASKITNNAHVDAKAEFYNGDLIQQRYYSYILLDSLSGSNNAGCQVETFAEKVQI